jgi:hypothetical protein
MKKVELKPEPILHPHPVLLVGTYGPDGRPNLMAASWGGICCSEPPCVSVALREKRVRLENCILMAGWVMQAQRARLRCHIGEASPASLSLRRGKQGR